MLDCKKYCFGYPAGLPEVFFALRIFVIFIFYPFDGLSVQDGILWPIRFFLFRGRKAASPFQVFFAEKKAQMPNFKRLQHKRSPCCLIYLNR